jgi:hypothetical protein
VTLPSLSQLITCGGCAEVWTGLRTAHCAACNQTFIGPSSFDMHRPGRCLTPSELGLGARERPWGVVWGRPEARPDAANRHDTRAA